MYIVSVWGGGNGKFSNEAKFLSFSKIICALPTRNDVSNQPRVNHYRVSIIH